MKSNPKDKFYNTTGSLGWIKSSKDMLSPGFSSSSVEKRRLDDIIPIPINSKTNLNSNYNNNLKTSQSYKELINPNEDIKRQYNDSKGYKNNDDTGIKSKNRKNNPKKGKNFPKMDTVNYRLNTVQDSDLAKKYHNYDSFRRPYDIHVPNFINENEKKDSSPYMDQLDNFDRNELQKKTKKQFEIYPDVPDSSAPGQSLIDSTLLEESFLTESNRFDGKGEIEKIKCMINSLEEKNNIIIQRFDPELKIKRYSMTGRNKEHRKHVLLPEKNSGYLTLPNPILTTSYQQQQQQQKQQQQQQRFSHSPGGYIASPPVNYHSTQNQNISPNILNTRFYSPNYESMGRNYKTDYYSSLDNRGAGAGGGTGSGSGAGGGSSTQNEMEKLTLRCNMLTNDNKKLREKNEELMKELNTKTMYINTCDDKIKELMEELDYTKNENTKLFNTINKLKLTIETDKSTIKELTDIKIGLENEVENFQKFIKYRQNEIRDEVTKIVYECNNILEMKYAHMNELLQKKENDIDNLKNILKEKLKRLDQSLYDDSKDGNIIMSNNNNSNIMEDNSSLNINQDQLQHHQHQSEQLKSQNHQQYQPNYSKNFTKQYQPLQEQRKSSSLSSSREYNYPQQILQNKDTTNNDKISDIIELRDEKCDDKELIKQLENIQDKLDNILIIFEQKNDYTDQEYYEIRNMIDFLKIEKREIIKKLMADINIDDNDNSVPTMSDNNPYNSPINRQINKEYNDLQQKCNALSHENYNLNEEVKNLNRYIEKLNKDAHTHQQKLNIMEKLYDEKLVNLNNIIDELKGKNRELLEKIQHQYQQTESKDGNSQEFKKPFDETLQIKGQSSPQKRQISELGNKLTMFEQQIKDLLEKNKLLLLNNEESKREIERLNNEYQLKLIEMKNTNEEANKIKQIADQECKKLNEIIKSLEFQNTKLVLDLRQQSESESNRLKDKILAEREKEIASLKCELEKMNEQIKVIEFDLANKQNHLKEKTKSQLKLEAQLNDMQKMLLENEKLVNENKKLSSRIDQMQAKLNDINEAEKNANEKNTNLIDELSQNNQYIQELEAVNQKLNKDVNELNNQLKISTSELSKFKSDLEELNIIYNNHVTTYDNEIKQLKKDLSERENVIVELEKQINKNKLEAPEIKNNLEELQNQNENLANHNTELREEIISLTQKADELQTLNLENLDKIQKFENQILNLNKELNTISKNYEQVLNTIKQKNQAYEDLENMNQELLKILRETEAKSNDVDENMHGVILAKQDEIDKANEKIEELMALTKQNEDNIFTLRDQIKQKDKDIDEMKSLLSQKDNELNNCKNKLELLEDDNQSLQVELNRLQESNTNLEEALNDKERELEQEKEKSIVLSEKLPKLEEEDKLNSKKILEMKNELKAATNLLKKIQNDLQNSQNYNKELEQQISSNLNEISNLQAKINDLTLVNTQLVNQVKDLTQNIKDLENDNCEMEKERLRLEYDISSTTQQLNDFTKENQDKQETVDQLNEKICTLKENYDMLNEKHNQVMNELSELNVKLNQNQVQIDELTKLNESNQNTIKDYETQIQEGSKREQVLFNELKELQDQHLETTNELIHHKKRLTHDVEKVRSHAIKEKDNIAQEAKAKIEQLLNDIEGYKQMNEQLQVELNHAIDEKNDLESRFNELQEDCNRHMDENNRLLSIVKDVEVKLGVSDGNIETLKDNIMEKEKEIGRLDGKIKEVEREMNEVQDEMKILRENNEKEKETLRNDIEEMRKIYEEQIQNARNEIDNKERELKGQEDANKISLNKLQENEKIMEELNKSIKQYEKNLLDLQSRLADANQIEERLKIELQNQVMKMELMNQESVGLMKEKEAIQEKLKKSEEVNKKLQKGLIEFENESNKRLSEMSQQKHDLEIRIQYLQENLESLGNQNKHLSHDNIELNNQILTINKELDLIKSANQKLIDKLNQIENQNNSINDNYNALKYKYEQDIATISKEKENLDKILDDMKMTLTKTNDEKVILNQRLLDLSTEKALLNDQLALKNQELKQIDDKNKQLVAEIKNQARHKEDMEMEILSLHKEKDDIMVMLANVKNDLAQSKQQNQVLEDKLRKILETDDYINVELANVKKINDELKSTLNEKIKEHDKIKAELKADYQDKMNQLGVKISDLQETIDELQDEKANLQNELRDITQQKAALQEKLDLVEAQRQHFTKIFARLVTLSKSHIQPILEIKNSYREIKKDLEVMNTEFKEKTHEVERSIQVLKGDFESKARGMSAQIDDLTKRNTILEKDLISLSEEKGNFDKEMERINQQLNNGLESIDKLSKEKKNLEDEISNLKYEFENKSNDNKKKYEMSLAALMKEKEEISKNLSKVQGENESLLLKITKLEEDLLNTKHDLNTKINDLSTENEALSSKKLSLEQELKLQQGKLIEKEEEFTVKINTLLEEYTKSKEEYSKSKEEYTKSKEESNMIIKKLLNEKESLLKDIENLKEKIRLDNEGYNELMNKCETLNLKIIEIQNQNKEFKEEYVSKIKAQEEEIHELYKAKEHMSCRLITLEKDLKVIIDQDNDKKIEKLEQFSIMMEGLTQSHLLNDENNLKKIMTHIYNIVEKYKKLNKDKEDLEKGNKDIKNELNEIHDQKTAIEIELNEVKNELELAKLNQEQDLSIINQLRLQNEKLNKINIENQTAIQEHKAKYDQLESVNSGLQEKFKELETNRKELDQYKSREYDEMLASKTKMIKDMEDALSAETQKISEYEETISNLNEKLKQSQNKLDELGKLKDLLAERDAKIKGIMISLEEKDALIDMQKQNIENLKTESTKHNKEIEQLIHDKADLVDKLETMNNNSNNIANQSDKNEEDKHKLEQAQQEINRLNDHIAKINLKCQNLENTVQLKTGQIVEFAEALKNSSGSQTDLVSILQANNEKTIQKLEEQFSQQKSIYEDRIKGYENNIKDLKSYLTKETETMKDLLNQKESLIKTLQHNEMSYKDKLIEMEVLTKNQQSKIVDMSGEIEKLMKVNGDLREQIENKKAEYNLALAKQDEQLNTINELNQKLAVTNSENQNVKYTVDQLQKQILSLNNTLQEKNDEFKELENKVKLENANIINQKDLKIHEIEESFSIKIKQKDEELSKKINEIESLENEVSKYKTRFDKLTKDKHDQELEYSEKLMQATKDLELNAQEIKKLQNELMAIDLEKKNLTKENEDLKLLNKKLNDDLTENNKELEALRSSTLTNQQDTQKLKDKISEYEDEKTRLIELVKQLEDEIKNKEKLITDLIEKRASIEDRTILDSKTELGISAIGPFMYDNDDPNQQEEYKDNQQQFNQRDDTSPRDNMHIPSQTGNTAKDHTTANREEHNIKNLETKLEELSMKNLNFQDENSALKRNIIDMDKFRLENDKFKKEIAEQKIVNQKLFEELKEAEINEEKLNQQITLLKKEIERYQQQMDQSQITYEKNHLKNMLNKLFNILLKSEKNASNLKEADNYLKIICSLIGCTEKEKNDLVALLKNSEKKKSWWQISKKKASKALKYNNDLLY